MANRKVQEIIGLMQKNLECVICLEMLNNPVSTKCGHQFCKFCLMEFLETKRSVPCPLCKKPITKRSLNERHHLGEMVDNVRGLIVAFQKDTGIAYSPPRGPQMMNFFPCTPEAIPTKTFSDTKRKINMDNKGKYRPRNVRHCKRMNVEEEEIHVDGHDDEDSSAVDVEVLQRKSGKLHRSEGAHDLKDTRNSRKKPEATVIIAEITDTATIQDRGISAEGRLQISGNKMTRNKTKAVAATCKTEQNMCKKSGVANSETRQKKLLQCIESGCYGASKQEQNVKLNNSTSSEEQGYQLDDVCDLDSTDHGVSKTSVESDGHDEDLVGAEVGDICSTKERSTNPQSTQETNSRDVGLQNADSDSVINSSSEHALFHTPVLKTKVEVEKCSSARVSSRLRSKSGQDKASGRQDAVVEEGLLGNTPGDDNGEKGDSLFDQQTLLVEKTYSKKHKGEHEKNLKVTAWLKSLQGNDVSKEKDVKSASPSSQGKCDSQKKTGKKTKNSVKGKKATHVNTSLTDVSDVFGFDELLDEEKKCAGGGVVDLSHDSDEEQMDDKLPESEAQTNKDISVEKMTDLSSRIVESCESGKLSRQDHQTVGQGKNIDNQHNKIPVPSMETSHADVHVTDAELDSVRADSDHEGIPVKLKNGGFIYCTPVCCLQQGTSNLQNGNKNIEHQTEHRPMETLPDKIHKKQSVDIYEKLISPAKENTGIGRNIRLQENGKLVAKVSKRRIFKTRDSINIVNKELDGVSINIVNKELHEDGVKEDQGQDAVDNNRQLLVLHKKAKQDDVDADLPSSDPYEFKSSQKTPTKEEGKRNKKGKKKGKTKVKKPSIPVKTVKSKKKYAPAIVETHSDIDIVLENQENREEVELAEQNGEMPDPMQEKSQVMKGILKKAKLKSEEKAKTKCVEVMQFAVPKKKRRSPKLGSKESSQEEMAKLVDKISQAEDFDLLTCTQDAVASIEKESQNRDGTQGTVDSVDISVKHGKKVRFSETKIVINSENNQMCHQELVHNVQTKLSPELVDASSNSKEQEDSLHQQTDRKELKVKATLSSDALNERLTDPKQHKAVKSQKGREPRAIARNPMWTCRKNEEEEEETAQTGYHSDETDDLDIHPSAEEFEEPNLELQTDEMKRQLSQDEDDDVCTPDMDGVLLHREDTVVAEAPALYEEDICVDVNTEKTKPNKTKQTAGEKEAQLSVPETLALGLSSDQDSSTQSPGEAVEISRKCEPPVIGSAFKQKEEITSVQLHGKVTRNTVPRPKLLATGSEINKEVQGLSNRCLNETIKIVDASTHSGINQDDNMHEQCSTEDDTQESVSILAPMSIQEPSGTSHSLRNVEHQIVEDDIKSMVDETVAENNHTSEVSSGSDSVVQSRKSRKRKCFMLTDSPEDVKDSNVFIESEKTLEGANDIESKKKRLHKLTKSSNGSDDATTAQDLFKEVNIGELTRNTEATAVPETIDAVSSENISPSVKKNKLSRVRKSPRNAKSLVIVQDSGADVRVEEIDEPDEEMIAIPETVECSVDTEMLENVDSPSKAAQSRLRNISRTGSNGVIVPDTCEDVHVEEITGKERDMIIVPETVECDIGMVTCSLETEAEREDSMHEIQTDKFSCASKKSEDSKKKSQASRTKRGLRRKGVGKASLPVPVIVEDTPITESPGDRTTCMLEKELGTDHNDLSVHETDVVESEKYTNCTVVPESVLETGKHLTTSRLSRSDDFVEVNSGKENLSRGKLGEIVINKTCKSGGRKNGDEKDSAEDIFTKDSEERQNDALSSSEGITLCEHVDEMEENTHCDEYGTGVEPKYMSDGKPSKTEELNSKTLRTPEVKKLDVDSESDLSQQVSAERKQGVRAARGFSARKKRKEQQQMGEKNIDFNTSVSGVKVRLSENFAEGKKMGTKSKVKDEERDRDKNEFFYEEEKEDELQTPSKRKVIANKKISPKFMQTGSPRKSKKLKSTKKMKTVSQSENVPKRNRSRKNVTKTSVDQSKGVEQDDVLDIKQANESLNSVVPDSLPLSTFSPNIHTRKNSGICDEVHHNSLQQNKSQSEVQRQVKLRQPVDELEPVDDLDLEASSPLPDLMSVDRKDLRGKWTPEKLAKDYTSARPKSSPPQKTNVRQHVDDSDSDDSLGDVVVTRISKEFGKQKPYFRKNGIIDDDSDEEEDNKEMQKVDEEDVTCVGDTVEDKGHQAQQENDAVDLVTPRESSSSEDEPITGKKHKTAAIVESEDEDDVSSQDSSSRQLNLTSSSAFSSQSEPPSTQQRQVMEKEIQQMQEEMEKLQAQIAQTRGADDKQGGTAADGKKRKLSSTESVTYKKRRKDDDGDLEEVAESDVEGADVISVDEEDDDPLNLLKQAVADDVDVDERIDDNYSDADSEDLFLSPPAPSPPMSDEGRCQDNSRTVDENLEDMAKFFNDIKKEMEGDVIQSSPVPVSPISQTVNPEPSAAGERNEGTGGRRVLGEITNHQTQGTAIRPACTGFLATGLLNSQLAEVRKFASLSDCKLHGKFNPSVSHVIIREAKGHPHMCDRTLKFFQGVAQKCWIVSYKWVEESLKSGSRLMEEDFEIQGDTANGSLHYGPKRSRCSMQQLFQGFTVLCIGDSDGLSIENLCELLEACGAQVTADPGQLSDADPGSRLAVTCTDMEGEEEEEEEHPTKEETKAFNALYKEYGTVTVTREWVLDSLTMYRLQPLEDYVLTAIKNVKLPKLTHN